VLKFIIWTIIILWLLRQVAGFFFRSWFESAVKEQQKRTQEYYNQQSGYNKKREGEISFINKTPSKESKSDKIGGDYVDFEEVKD
jgi:hypothetical protein